MTSWNQHAHIHLCSEVGIVHDRRGNPGAASPKLNGDFLVAGDKRIEPADVETRHPSLTSVLPPVNPEQNDQLRVRGASVAAERAAQVVTASRAGSDGLSETEASRRAARVLKPEDAITHDSRTTDDRSSQDARDDEGKGGGGGIVNTPRAEVSGAFQIVERWVLGQLLA